MDQSGDVQAGVDLIGPYQERQRPHEQAESHRPPVREPAGCAPLERAQDVVGHPAKRRRCRKRVHERELAVSRCHQALPAPTGAGM